MSDRTQDEDDFRWEISPHPYSTDFDTYVTNDDEQARQAAMDAAEAAWDQMEVGEEIHVVIKRVRE